MVPNLATQNILQKNTFKMLEIDSSLIDRKRSVALDKGTFGEKDY